VKLDESMRVKFQRVIETGQVARKSLISYERERSSSNLVEMVILVISRSGSKLGHATFKTRSQVQIIEKSCPHSSGLNFGPIIFKLGQNVYVNDI
jgi:hypothetical protein